MGPGTALLDGVDRPRRGLRDVLRSRRLALLALAAVALAPSLQREAAAPPPSPAVMEFLPGPAEFQCVFPIKPGRCQLEIPEPEPPEVIRCGSIDWCPATEPAPASVSRSPDLDRVAAPLREVAPKLRTFAERRHAADRRP